MSKSKKTAKKKPDQIDPLEPVGHPKKAVTLPPSEFGKQREKEVAESHPGHPNYKSNAPEVSEDPLKGSAPAPKEAAAKKKRK